MKKSYFTIYELTRSRSAETKGVDNTPPLEAKINLKTLINECLNPIREMWGRPIIVNSGYRSPTVNRIVGGGPRSQHLLGEAADITAGSPDLNKRLFQMILDAGISFDQLIDEKGYRWIHISYKSEKKNRMQVLHLP